MLEVLSLHLDTTRWSYYLFNDAPRSEGRRRLKPMVVCFMEVDESSL